VLELGKVIHELSAEEGVELDFVTIDGANYFIAPAVARLILALSEERNGLANALEKLMPANAVEDAMKRRPS
jgi:hypothetical protein